MEPARARLTAAAIGAQAARLIRNLRRPRIAAAAMPNSAIIGGAGTSVPLLLPEVDELVEDEDEVELDVEVEDDVEVELDVLVEDDELVLVVTLPLEVETSPVEVLTEPVEVETSPVEVLTEPVEVETSPVEVLTEPVEVETSPVLELELVVVETSPVEVEVPPVEVEVEDPPLDVEVEDPPVELVVDTSTFTTGASPPLVVVELTITLPPPLDPEKKPPK